MSDDEYYDSPYDEYEYEEMPWDGDPAPDLADDLAQHALHSPVWQDDPGGDLKPYYSDWEYYTDDYYDDDPVILQENPIDGGPSSLRGKAKPHAKIGRKRKLDDVYDRPDIAEDKVLRSTIRGTVWARDRTPNIRVFHYGQQDKVALLTDWKERFQHNPEKRHIRDKANSQRDLSWANDLGLEDMGLTNIKSKSGTDHGVQIEDSDGENEGDLGDESNEEGFQLLMTDEHSLEENELEPHIYGTTDNVKAAHSLQTEVQDNFEITDAYDQLHQPSRKRRKASAKPIPPHTGRLTVGTNLPNISDNDLRRRETESCELTNGDMDKTSEHLSDSEYERIESRQTRKRRLSLSEEENQNSAKSNQFNRAKRIASSKLKRDMPDSSVYKSPTANTKATTFRKS